MEDDHYLRLRDRSKDPPGHPLAQGSMKAGKSSSSFNKRKRNGYGEPQIRNRSSFGDDLDEKTENTEVASASDDEDDDDLPPPTIPQRTANSRSLRKFREDGVLVDLFTVPRKARSGWVPRSAAVKKSHESSAYVANSGAGRSSAASVHISAPPISLSTPLKHLKKLKLSVSKLRSEKVSKVCYSPGMSQQEVEAAEALSDLSRMFSNPICTSPAPDVKVELKPTFPAGTSISSVSASVPYRKPAFVTSPDLLFSHGSANASALTPASGSALAQVEAPKKKRPHPTFQEDLEDLLPKGPHRSFASAATKMEADRLRHTSSISQNCIEPDKEVASSNEALTSSSPNMHVAYSHIGVPVNPEDVPPSPLSQQLALVDVPLDASSRVEEMDKAVSCLAEKEVKLSLIPDKGSFDDSATPASLEKEAEVSKSTLDADTLLAEQELSKRSFLSPAVQNVSSANLGIDVMAPPEHRTKRDHLGAAVGDLQERENNLHNETQAAVVFEGPNNNLEKGTAREQIGEAASEQSLLKQASKEQIEGELSQSDTHHIQKEGRIQLDQQHIQKEGRNIKSEVRVTEKPERSGAPHQSSASPSTCALDITSQNQPALSVSMNVPQWSGVLPPLGIYGPTAMASAWPRVASLAGVAVDDSQSNIQLPSCVIPSRQSWKRCASHVYIAHFISIQQRVAQHPFFAALYGNPASIYGAKQYISTPPTDSLCGTVAGAFTDKNVPGASGPVSILSSNDVTCSAISSLFGKEKVAALTSLQMGVKERASPAHADGFLRPSLEQHLHAEEHRLSTPVQSSSSTGSSTSPAIALALSGTSGSLGMLGGTAGKTGPESGPMVCPEVPLSRGVPMTTNAPAINMASAQAQYLQALIQHNTFPFIFPPHFGSSFSNTSLQVGHQQSHQFFNSSYFHSQPPVQQQSAGLGSQQKQQKAQVPPDFPSTGPSLLPLRSQKQHSEISPQRSQSQRAEDRTMVQTDTLTERKPSSVQQSFYGHVPSAQDLSSGSINPVTSGALQARSVLPEFGHSVVSGIKQNGKSQLQQPFSPVQQLPSNLSTHLPSTQLQSTGSGTGFSLGLKGLDSKGSHVFHGMSIPNMTRGSVGPGPLGLAPVAAVMAPEGHAVLSNVVDSMKSHTQFQQSHIHHSHHLKHVTQVNQQQQPSIHGHKSSTGADEIRSSLDAKSYNGASREDRKSVVKRATSMPFTRIDFEPQANASNASSVNVPVSLSHSNGNLVMQSTMALPSQPAVKLPSVSSSASNMSVNQNIKQSIPRAKLSPAQDNLVTSSSSLPSFTDRGSAAVNSKKIPYSASPFPPSGHTISNSQRQAQTQTAALKCLQRPTERLVTAAPDNAQGLSVVPANIHGKQLQNPSVTWTASAPCLPLTVAMHTPMLSATPPFPQVSKSQTIPVSNAPPPLPPVSKAPRTGNSSLSATLKAATASAKRFASTSSNPAPLSQNVASKNVQSQKSHAQQVQATQLQPSILGTSSQQAALGQHFQQQQSHLPQQPIHQSQKQSSQQQQQVLQPIFLQQQQPYLQQQHQSQTQVHSKGQQSQAVQQQPQQQHVRAKPAPQSPQQGSLSQQQVLKHLQLQKHSQVAMHPSVLSTPAETSSSSHAVLMMGSNSSSYYGSHTGNFASDEKAPDHAPGARHNQSSPLGMTGLYQQPSMDHAAMQRALEPAATVDAATRDQVNGNVSAASLLPPKGSAVAASSSTLNSSIAKPTPAMKPMKTASIQPSLVDSAENVPVSERTSSTVTATGNSNWTTSTLANNDGDIKNLGPCTLLSEDPDGKVPIEGTSAVVQKGAVCSNQANILSTHQISLSTTSGTSVNVSSNSHSE